MTANSNVPEKLDRLILSVVNSVTAHRYDELPQTMTVEALGLDSLAFSQLILEFESEFGEMSERAIDEIVTARNVGEIMRILSEAASAD